MENYLFFYMGLIFFLAYPGWSSFQHRQLLVIAIYFVGLILVDWLIKCYEGRIRRLRRDLRVRDFIEMVEHYFA